MQPLVIVAEALFLILFLATLREYLVRRDPVSRDVALVFSALAVLLVLEIWNRLGGGTPDAVRRLGLTLFALQPVFALHLVSLIHPVPRPVMAGAAAAMVLFALPAVLVPDLPRLAATGALIAFVAVEAIAAFYLVVAARQRRGPGAGRLLIAAVSTGLLAATLVLALAGAAVRQVVGPGAADVIGPLSTGLALIAAVGYVVAFLPPYTLRRYWRSATAMDYANQLIEVTAEPIESIWRSLTDLTVRVAGGFAAVVVATPDRATIEAASGLRLRPDDRAVDPAEVRELMKKVGNRPETPIEDAGALAQRLAAGTGARFVSVVPLRASQAGSTAAVIVLARMRNLFHSSDLDVVSTLGTQTAIVAERRLVLAEQEALTERLAATIDALRAASEAKSDFLASMSHELRTPLSAILGFSDLMRREPSVDENVTVPLEWVEHVHRGGEHLLSLINDVLDLAKVEAGRLELEPERIDLGTLATEVVSGLRPLADRKQLELTADIDSLAIDADRGRVRQILYNLLSNAIKYTPDGGSVRIATTLAGGETRIAVVDTGVGIAPEDHDAVFEEFRQVGAIGERQPGTGLGLALTRRLVEAHGGRIELESARGKGSTFTVVLPGGEDGSAPQTRARRAAAAGAADRAAAALPPAGEASADGASPLVLVIEDDPSVVRLLREYLEPSGYRIKAATTGEDGLMAMRLEEPAAVILDVLLPGMDGWEVLRRVKEDELLRVIPVVILTVVDEREVGLALGAVDYLVKPVNREALLASLGRYTFVTKARERSVRVLAVDDEPSALDLVRSALEPEGFEVVTAGSGREALAHAAEADFDLVICDLVMPEVDGFEVVASLKADPRTAPVPILVCTAHDLTDADKGRLNGKILGIVSKGADAMDGLRSWLGVAVGAGG